MNNNSDKLLVMSFPRSGSNFLALNLSNSTGLNVSLSHDIEDYDPKIATVSCLRHPKDAIASMLYVSSKLDKIIDINVEVLYHLNKYNKITRYIIDNNIKTVPFYALIENPEYIIEKIAKTFDINLKEYKINYPKDNEKISFIASSRGNDKYDYFKKIIADLPDSMIYPSYELYHIALKNAI